MSAIELIRTPITDLLKINHPILLAGMNVAAGPEAGGRGHQCRWFGRHRWCRLYSGDAPGAGRRAEELPEGQERSLRCRPAPPPGRWQCSQDQVRYRRYCEDTKDNQANQLALAYSYDYTKGKLNELVDIIIESGAKLFVSAVGVPPKAVVERLHGAGILCMNMIGHPKHVQKALDVGVDIICAQGGEGGGHTGDVPTTILIPTVAKLVQGRKSPLTGQPVQVIAAGGLFNGNSVAAALMLGASAVWIGTRFILADEAGAPVAHQEAVRTSGFEDNIRTIIFTGRPLRVRKNPYILNWEENRAEEIKQLTAKGIIPVEHDFENLPDDVDDDVLDNARPFLMGKVAAVVNEKKSAKAIVDELVTDAAALLKKGNQMVAKL